MANDTTLNGGLMWSLDTAAVIATTSIRIKSLRWYSKAATAGDDLSVEDSGGEKIWESVADAANYVEAQDFGERGKNFNGFEVAVIDSGTLYVTLA